MHEYDSLDFHRGIEQLQEAESLGDTARRKTIIEVMLGIFDGMGGNLHHGIQSYIAELDLFPDDPVDFTKLHQLHYEFVVHWASTMDCERSKEEKKVEILLPFARRDIRRQKGTQKPRRPELDEYIEIAVRRDPNKTREQYYEEAPEWVTDQIGLDRFVKRVSKARKKIKK